MDEALALRQELEASASAVEQIIAQFDTALGKLAKDWAGLDNFEFLGSGPGKGSAAYGAAKLLEAAGSHALYQDVEEWAHLQFFVARAQQTGTVLIAPADSYALSRAVEIAGFLETLQRPYRVLGRLRSRSSAVTFGTQVRWAPDSTLSPTTSTSS